MYFDDAVVFVQNFLLLFRLALVILGEFIYICKMIKPGIFSRLSQPVHFSRFKSDNLLFRLQPGKMYRLTEPGKNARLGHFTGID